MPGLGTSQSNARELLQPEVLARLKNLDLVARSVVEGFLIGLHGSPHRGFSVGGVFPEISATIRTWQRRDTGAECRWEAYCQRRRETGLRLPFWSPQRQTRAQQAHPAYCCNACRSSRDGWARTVSSISRYSILLATRTTGPMWIWRPVNPAAAVLPISVPCGETRSSIPAGMLSTTPGSWKIPVAAGRRECACHCRKMNARMAAAATGCRRPSRKGPGLHPSGMARVSLQCLIGSARVRVPTLSPQLATCDDIGNQGNTVIQ